MISIKLNQIVYVVEVIDKGLLNCTWTRMDQPFHYTDTVVKASCFDNKEEADQLAESINESNSFDTAVVREVYIRVE